MGLLSRSSSAASDKKITREITVLNRLGLHARPAAMFVKVCNRHKSEIWVEKDGEQVNGEKHHGPHDARRRPGLEAARHLRRDRLGKGGR